jgi:hypothetical protein
MFAGGDGGPRALRALCSGSLWGQRTGNYRLSQGADTGAERYLELLKNAKVKGYLFEQQNYWSKDFGKQ